MEVDVDPDAERMMRVATGDRRAFAELFDRYQPAVANFALRYVGDRARAEELTQDIFLRLYSGAKNYRPTAHFKTFLFHIAANHCLNELRRGEYRLAKVIENDASEPALLRVEAPVGDGPSAALEGRDLERAIRLALSEMTDRERLAFTLCRFEGLPYKDIAQALNTSESAVKSLIHRATLGVSEKVELLRAGNLPARNQI